MAIGYGGLIVSEKAHKEMGNDKYARTPIGSGPYTLESWTSNAEVVLKKNPDYWQKGLPYLDQIVYRIIPDSTVRLQALTNGEVDFISNPDAKSALQVKDNPKLVFTSTAGWNWDFQEFTFPPYVDASFPTQNKLVRQAISYAIDREAIAKEIYSGRRRRLTAFILNGFWGNWGQMVRYLKNGDLKKAKEPMVFRQASRASTSRSSSPATRTGSFRREVELVAPAAGQPDWHQLQQDQGLGDLATANNLWLQQKKFQMLLEDVTVVSPDTDATMYSFLHSKGVPPPATRCRR